MKKGSSLLAATPIDIIDYIINYTGQIVCHPTFIGSTLFLASIFGVCVVFPAVIASGVVPGTQAYMAKILAANTAKALSLSVVPSSTLGSYMGAKFLVFAKYGIIGDLLIGYEFFPLPDSIGCITNISRNLPAVQKLADEIIKQDPNVYLVLLDTDAIMKMIGLTIDLLGK